MSGLAPSSADQQSAGLCENDAREYDERKERTKARLYHTSAKALKLRARLAERASRLIELTPSVGSRGEWRA